MEFELSQPFKPFEQLLSVLPAASKELLPKVSLSSGVKGLFVYTNNENRSCR
jgi:5'-3' exonuclease